MLRALCSICILGCAIFFPFSLQAGGGCSVCTIDTVACSGQFGAVCPDTLPPGNVGISFDENLTFFMPAKVTVDQIVLPQPITIPIVNITVDTIELGDFIVIGLFDVTLDEVQLLQGLSWTCDGGLQGPCVYYPDTADLASQYGCLNICGSPCSFSGTSPVQLNFTLHLNLTQINLSQAPFPFNLIPVNLIPDTVTIPFQLRSTFVMDNGLNEAEISKTPDTKFLCQGNSIMAAAPGFTTYNWSSGQNTDSIFISAAGKYSLTVMDANGCTQNTSVEIFDLKAEAGSDTAICANQITRLQGSGGDFFQWQPALHVSDNNVSDPVIYGLASTTQYILTVGNGVCSSADTISIIIDNIGCAGACDGECQVSKLGCAAVFPSICQTILPLAVTGDDYSESFSFFFPDTVGSNELLANANVPNIQIPGFGDLQDLLNFLPNIPIPVKEYQLSVSRLPQGFTWECDQIGNNNRYYPGLYPSVTEFGCIKLCAEDVCDQAGEYEVVVTANVLFNLPLPFQIPIPGFNGFRTSVQLKVNLPVRSVDGDFIISGNTIISLGESTTLSVPSGFASYQWSTGETATSITVSGFETYSVTAVDHSGCQQVAEVTISPITRMADLPGFTNSVKVYPNPNNGGFEVSIEQRQGGHITLELFTIIGQRVSIISFEGKLGMNILPLNFRGLSDGAYLLKVTSSDGVVNKKIVVE